MKHPRPERLLEYAAQRAKAHPEYLAWVLARYVEREHIAEDELSTRLGIVPHDLRRLALCLRPRAECFADDIRQISAKFDINPTALATVVRFVDSFEAMAASDTQEASADSGLLMAARARKQPPTPRDNEHHDHDHPGS